MNTQELVNAIMDHRTTSAADIAALFDAVRYVQDRLIADRRLRVGQRVIFGKPGGHQKHGEIVKVNEKTFKIKVDNDFRLWTCSKSLAFAEK